MHECISSGRNDGLWHRWITHGTGRGNHLSSTLRIESHSDEFVRFFLFLEGQARNGQFSWEIPRGAPQIPAARLPASRGPPPRRKRQRASSSPSCGSSAESMPPSQRRRHSRSRTRAPSTGERAPPAHLNQRFVVPAALMGHNGINYMHGTTVKRAVSVHSLHAWALQTGGDLFEPASAARTRLQLLTAKLLEIDIPGLTLFVTNTRDVPVDGSPSSQR